MIDHKGLPAKRFLSPVASGCLVGTLLAAAVIVYSYDYAVSHDPGIVNFQHYLVQKPYRLLQFAVSLLPIAVGYFFGRSHERLLALRGLYYEAVVEKARQENNPTFDVQNFGPESLRQLTHREREILELICEGLGNREIAGLLFISEKTVKNHINSIFRKLKVSDRTNAALTAIEKGLVSK